MHERVGGVSSSSVEIFLSHSTEKFRWGTLRCFRKFRVSQIFMHKKGISLNSVEKISSHSADKLRSRALVFRKNSGIEIFQANDVGSFTVLLKTFFLTGRKKLRRGTMLCFRKILVGKKFLCIRGGGGITIFRRKVFVSLYQNISLDNTLVFQKIFCNRNFSCIGEGGASRFCRKFLSHRTQTESFVKEPFCFPESFGYGKKFMDKRGHITIFSRNFHVSQCRKTS